MPCVAFEIKRSTVPLVHWYEDQSSTKILAFTAQYNSIKELDFSRTNSNNSNAVLISSNNFRRRYFLPNARTYIYHPRFISTVSTKSKTLTSFYPNFFQNQ